MQTAGTPSGNRTFRVRFANLFLINWVGKKAENGDFIILPETKIGGPGETYVKRTRNVRLPDGVPAICIFAEGVRYRAFQS